MKRCLVIILAFVLFFAFLISCGGGDSKAQKEDTGKIEKKAGLTVETASQIEYGKIAILMDKYYPKFLNKKYEEVKDLYEQYLKEIDALYGKYRVTKEEFKKYRMYHLGAMQPYMQSKTELDYWKKYPAYIDATNVVYQLGEAKKESEKK